MRVECMLSPVVRANDAAYSQDYCSRTPAPARPAAPSWLYTSLWGVAFDVLNCLLSLLSVSMYVVQTYYDEVRSRAPIAHLSSNTSALARAHASRTSQLEYAQRKNDFASKQVHFLSAIFDMALQSMTWRSYTSTTKYVC